MFRKVLYPTDFSEEAKKVIPYLKQLKEAGTQEVVILHVVDLRSLRIPSVYTLGEFAELGEIQATEAQRKARRLAKSLRDIGLITTIRVEQGVPFKEILRVEAEEAVSLTVLGSHGRSNVAEMLLGSVSEKVIRKAKHPVLVVKR